MDSTRIKSIYLQGYNLLSALAWFTVLARVALLVPLVGVANVYGGVATWTRWTQTAALLEIGNVYFRMYISLLLIMFWGGGGIHFPPHSLSLSFSLSLSLSSLSLFLSFTL